jgi:hypothetical protein
MPPATCITDVESVLLKRVLRPGDQAASTMLQWVGLSRTAVKVRMVSYTTSLPFSTDEVCSVAMIDMVPDTVFCTAPCGTN